MEASIPGFNIAPYGGGFSVQGPSNTTETRRKHRWVFETLGRGAGTFSQAELLVLQSAMRPSFKFEEPEMHHNQEVSRFAGKQDWEPITLTWYDVEQNPDVSRGLYNWIETVVNMMSLGVSHPSIYKRSATLGMLTGMGVFSEHWTISGTWPATVNWGELDYTSTEIQTIECSMRFDRAVRDCTGAPGIGATVPNCPV